LKRLDHTSVSPHAYVLPSVVSKLRPNAIHVLAFVFLGCGLVGASTVICQTTSGIGTTGGLLISARPTASGVNPTSLRTAVAVLTKRFAAMGIKSPRVEVRNVSAIIIELPAFNDAAAARRTVEQPGSLSFRIVPELDHQNGWRTQPEIKGGKPTGFEQIVSVDGKPVTASLLKQRVFSKSPAVSSDQFLPNSRTEVGPRGTVIHFEIKDSAKRAFEDITRARINKSLAIFLDDKLIAAPNVNDAIPGRGVIEGRFTHEQAVAMSEMLNSGPLPVELKVTSVHVIHGRGKT